jgi:hypothetical protein
MNEEVEMQTLKILHLTLNADEELVLMEALCDHALKMQAQPLTLERQAKDIAGLSLQLKIGNQLYGK